MKTKTLWAVCAAVLITTALGGCSKSDSATSGGDTPYLNIKGSDTMVHLVSSWAESYMNANPEANVSVTGGGSGTGIAALLNGTADIAMASRKMKPKEHDLARKHGADVKEIVVARDGIAMIVNPKNPVTALTIAQLGDLFTGKVKNWSDVGGPDQPVTLLSRESSSGTYVFVQERVLDKQDYAASARLLPATSGVIQAVSNETWAIGYVGLGYASSAGDTVKPIAVKETETGDAILPSVKSVQTGAYALARPLQLYTQSSDNPAIDPFVQFCLSPAGQKIVAETGYVPVSSTEG